MVRPHELTFAADPAGRATVTGREYQGISMLYELTLDSGERLASRQAPDVVYPVGSRVRPLVVEGKNPVLFCDRRRIWPPVEIGEPDCGGGRIKEHGEEPRDDIEMGVGAAGRGAVGGRVRERQPRGGNEEPG
jgi:hypothetical protein